MENEFETKGAIVDSEELESAEEQVEESVNDEERQMIIYTISLSYIGTHRH